MDDDAAAEKATTTGQKSFDEIWDSFGNFLKHKEKKQEMLIKIDNQIETHIQALSKLSKARSNLVKN